MNEPDSRITLTLRGEHAKKGVSLDAFDGFITHFTTALRRHYRASKSEPPRRAGHPVTADKLATAFRLVEFKVGSGIAVLKPPLTDGDPGLGLASEVPTLAWGNLGSLLAAAESGEHLDDDVVEELEAAAKCLGKEGSFFVDYRSGDMARTHAFDLPEIARLRAPQVIETSRQHTITGSLHAIDLEPDHVAIRAASGMDWRCRYPDDLEQRVLTLVGKRVWARGAGKTTSPRVGTLDVVEIHPVAEYEQTALFTGAPLPLEQLMERQAIRGPQGLAAFADPEWEPDDESERFLEAIFAENE